MTFLSRLVPRSITAQITSIVAISVLFGVALLATIMLVMFGPPPDDGKGTLAHVAEITALMRAATTSAEAAAILSAAQQGDPELRRVAISNLRSDAGERPPLGSRLAVRQLANRPGIEVLSSLRDPAGPKSQIITRLDDRDALVFSAAVEWRLWPILLTPTALIIVIVTVSMVLLSFYAVRWVIAPLAAVANAAESFGRSPQDSAALGRTGPHEITQVTDALNEMRARIRALLEDRTRMLAAISHDLRTPLTRLRLRTERVTDASLQMAMLGDIVKISHMLDETLEFLRDDARSEAATRIDLPSFLQTVCSDFSDMGHAVSYEGPDRLPYACRPRALSRAVTNIVENAIKHGSNEVIVRLTSLALDEIEIEISDNGPGIPAALRDQVFEPFFKADAARRADNGGNGFGLGLSIARDIIKRHGGRIEMKPGEPTGLRVVMAMPIQRGMPEIAPERRRAS
ncbi:sensor histidine kinase [Bradyrhizobium sp. STM 3557]|uniref:sensor histidine kinase n=1 Tax=Bradyrhizobium sp. STM 3557 TaxID=578920 RepID=UPI00389051F8